MAGCTWLGRGRLWALAGSGWTSSVWVSQEEEVLKLWTAKACGSHTVSRARMSPTRAHAVLNILPTHRRAEGAPGGGGGIMPYTRVQSWTRTTCRFAYAS